MIFKRKINDTVKVFVVGFKEEENLAFERARRILSLIYPVGQRVEIVCIPEKGIGYAVYKIAPAYGFKTTAFHYQEGTFSKKAQHFVVKSKAESFKEKAAAAKLQAIAYSDLVVIASRVPEGSSTALALRWAQEMKIRKAFVRLAENEKEQGVKIEELPEIIRRIKDAKTKRVYEEAGKRQSWPFSAVGHQP